jgi:hypothetical protein
MPQLWRIYRIRLNEFKSNIYGLKFTRLLGNFLQIKQLICLKLLDSMGGGLLGKSLTKFKNKSYIEWYSSVTMGPVWNLWSYTFLTSYLTQIAAMSKTRRNILLPDRFELSTTIMNDDDEFVSSEIWSFAKVTLVDDWSVICVRLVMWWCVYTYVYTHWMNLYALWSILYPPSPFLAA